MHLAKYIYKWCFVAWLVVGGTTAQFSWLRTITDLTYCKFTECCNAEYVPYDIQKLRKLLLEKMFGQPLVFELVSILSAHKASLDSSTHRKAEVISLHGWSGVGKNYAASMVAQALFKKGVDSKFVLQFQGQKAIDYGDLGKSRDELFQKISSVVRKCSKALIIFDEVNEMDPGILDRIRSMLDHHNAVDGVDYRNTVFLFLSNIAGPDITDKLLELYSQGVKREDVKFHNFEPIIRKKSFFAGGFNKAAIIANHLIDHYVPFLPLEQQHVEQCARAVFREHGVEPTEQMWADALTVITYGPTEEQPIFANNGCKRFTKHIPYVIEKYSERQDRHEL